MSESECLHFLEENGISLPDGRAETSDWGAFAQKIIREVLNDPTVEYHFNYTHAYRLANDIKQCICQKMGVAAESGGVPTRDVLQYSTVYGGWQDQYEDYNCYSHVLSITNAFHNPGDFSGNYYSGNLPSVSTLASYTISDLHAIGYDCVRQLTYDPHSSLGTGKYVICLRRTTSGTADFHFMKWDSSYWRHKPGDTNILLLNASNPSSTTWTNENSKYDVIHTGTVTYSSSIYYFVFSSNHTWSYNEHGEHYCTYCGYVEEEK